MPIAPSWTISGLIRYELPVFGGGHKLGLQVDARARDAFYNDPANNSASIVPSYGVVNASIDLAEVDRSEEHTSELQSLMRSSYALFCLKLKIKNDKTFNCALEAR